MKAEHLKKSSVQMRRGVLELCVLSIIAEGEVYPTDIIKRLEEATGLDVTAPGFPAEMVDDEPEERGAEVIVRR